MTHLSRPFQLGLVAVGLLAVAWFVGLRGHSSSNSSASSASSTPAPVAASQPAPAAAKSVYHGSAPGVEGLTRAIAKARGAVTQSEREARHLEGKAAQVSSSSSAHTPAAGTSHASADSAASTKAGASGTRPATISPSHSSATTKQAQSSSTGGSPASESKSGSVTEQAPIESQLKAGKLVAILFWSPAGSVDQVVHRELQTVGHALGGRLAIYDALSEQVGSFGSVTRAIQVYSTPTILLVNSHGQTRSLTGLMDAFSIEQAVEEAKKS